MNSILKGNLFEEKAKQIIIAAISDGKLGLIPSCCKVFAKRPYFSRDRNSNIVFDLSIEVWPEGAERCHLLYLIECKDYSNHPVPINDLEEFASKIGQVVGIKAKGVFISKSRLQESAFNFAKSKDLMLIQVDDDSTSKIILHNAQRSKDLQVDTKAHWSEEAELLQQMGDIFAENENTSSNWDAAVESFLRKQLTNRTNWLQPGAQAVGLERLSKKLIEELSIKILNEFNPTVISRGTEFSFEYFSKYVNQKYGLIIICNQNIPIYKGKKINGYCDIANKKLYIDKELLGTGQFLFVFAHELAHFLLHSKIDLPQSSYDKMTDSEFDKAIGNYILLNEKHWLEWQANQFAAALIMPHQSILIKLIKWQKHQGISKLGRVWLDNQPCNILDFKKMITVLAYEFQVSRSILEYRMADLEIITYGSGKGHNNYSLFGNMKKPQTLQQILDRIFVHQ